MSLQTAPEEIPLDLSLLERKESILSPETPTIYVHGEIDQAMSRHFIDALETIIHERQAPAALINIASDGGEYFALATMLSAMMGAKLTLATFASGHAFSAAAVLLSAGHPGSRFISPFGASMIHSMITAHSPLGVEEAAGITKFEEQLNRNLMAFLARNCGLTLAKLRAAIRSGGSRILWLLPEEAKALHIVDHVGIPTITREVHYDLEGLRFKV